MARLLPLLAVLAALGAGACQTTTGHPPVARVTVTPKYVPEGDGCTTVVALDGTASKDELDDPSGQQPLWFRWELDEDGCVGPGPDVASGSLTAPTISVRIRGDRPVTVTLTVRDASGATAVRTAMIGITVPSGPTPDGGVAADGGAADAAPGHDAAAGG
jgi:hypothetical protein